MSALTQKVQILLTDEQHQALLGLAKARGRPLSVLVRETVVEQLVAEARRVAKQRAFEEMTAMDLPVVDWPEIEEQIERTHIYSKCGSAF